MASGGHVMQQQRGSVEARIKTLVNNDLKEICKAYNYQVSGTKAILQGRCTDILNNIVKRGDQTEFDIFNHRVGNHGQAPLRGSQPSSSATYSHTNDPFRSSPFYEGHEVVLPLNDLPEMPQNRHTVRSNVILTPDQVNRMKLDPSLKLLMYCGTGISAYGYVDVAFPNQLEVKINGDDVRANFKGLKNKPGSTKPVDITDKIRKHGGYQNQLSITYALTQKRFSFAVYLVKYVPADALTERIKRGQHGGGIITKQTVLNEMNKANADPDIAATSVRMSLKDPISTMRITLPVRSTSCSHNQCFDGSMFMALQEQAPQWSCPVCSKPVTFQSLCIDKYFEEILQQTPTSVEKVDIEPDGQWHMLKEEDSQPKGHSSRGKPAPYDDDFDDDDIVEVSDPTSKSRPTNGVPVGNGSTPSLLSPLPGSGFAINTPPLSSRGPSAAPSTASAQQSNKRPASAVIDLTLSDDEDEPPRPAKRQSTNTSTHHGTSAHSYSTPNSLPDPRPTSYYGGQTYVADSYRQPVSNTARPPSSHGRSSAAPDNYGSTFGNTNFATRTESPFRLASSSSPSFPVTGNTSNSWSQYSRPSTGQESGKK
ncbi:E3 SUMO-protein ligase pli1, partial [Pseudocercospora fuligena]